MHREQHALVLGSLHLGGEELIQGDGAHHRGVHHLACQHGNALFEHRGGAVHADEPDGQGVGTLDDDGLLVAAEVVGAHSGHVGLRVRAPGAHPVRVGAGVGLDCSGCAAVGVAFAQHRVHRTALDLLVPRASVLLLLGGRLLRIVRKLIPLRLELGDGGLELRHRGGDVRQLDDVGLRGGGQLAEFGQRIPRALVLREAVGERGEDTPGQGDVPGGHLHPRAGRIGLDHRQQGVGRQHRRLVGVGVDDGGHAQAFPSVSRLGLVLLDIKISPRRQPSSDRGHPVRRRPAVGGAGARFPPMLGAGRLRPACRLRRDPSGGSRTGSRSD